MAKPYDSLLKEIFEKVVPELAITLLHVPWGRTEEVKDKTQVTLEREADYLRKLLYDDSSQNCILHAEFHIRLQDLRNWMLLQRSLVRYRHGLPVRQVVFLIGDYEAPHFPNLIEELNLRYYFDVIPFNTIPVERFLQSHVPEVVMLSILGNFGDKKPEVIIPEILDKLQSLSGNKTELQRLQKQLEVLSNLRKLQPLTIKFIEAMPIIYNIEEDVRFQQGIEKGIEKGVTPFVINLLKSGIYTPEQIAALGNVSLELVEKLRSTLDKPVNSKLEKPSGKSKRSGRKKLKYKGL
jgi:hypothetical protein